MKQKVNPFAVVAILIVVLGTIFGVLYKITEAPISNKPGGMGGDPGVRVGTRPEDQPPPKVTTGGANTKGGDTKKAVTPEKKTATTPEARKDSPP